MFQMIYTVKPTKIESQEIYVLASIPTVISILYFFRGGLRIYVRIMVIDKIGFYIFYGIKNSIVMRI